jgi:hypothetical protein
LLWPVFDRATLGNTQAVAFGLIAVYSGEGIRTQFQSDDDVKCQAARFLYIFYIPPANFILYLRFKTIL